MSDWNDDVLRLEAELKGALARVAELEATAIENMSDDQMRRMCEIQGTTVEAEAAKARRVVDRVLELHDLKTKVAELEGEQQKMRADYMQTMKLYGESQNRVTDLQAQLDRAKEGIGECQDASGLEGAPDGEMHELPDRFVSMSLDERIEYVTDHVCSPEARSIIVNLQGHITDLQAQLDTALARVTELENLLKASIETNGRLIAHLNDESKEGGA